MRVPYIHRAFSPAINMMFYFVPLGVVVSQCASSFVFVFSIGIALFPTLDLEFLFPFICFGHSAV